MEQLEDLAQQAQRAAEARMRDVIDRFWAEDEGVEDAWEGIEMDEPYCNCDTCLVREVLTGAWPILLEAARREAELELAKKSAAE